MTRKPFDMFRLADLAFSMVVVFQFAEAWSIFCKNSANEFDTIDRYLTGTVNGDDIKANLEQAAKWLESKIEVDRSGADPLTGALETFVALKATINSQKCNHEGFKILQANNLGTREQALKNSAPSRRIDQIVRYYILEHSKLCYDLYPDLLVERKALLNPDHVIWIDRLRNSNRHMMIPGEHQSMSPREANCNEIEPKVEMEMLTNLQVRSAISFNAAKDPDVKYMSKIDERGRGKAAVDKDMVRGLFKKYILVPCQGYEGKIGKECYDAIRLYLYSSYVAENQPKKCRKVIGDKVALSICHHLVNDTKLRESTIRSLIYLID